MRQSRTTDVGDPDWIALAVTLPAPAGPSLVRMLLRDVDSTHVGAALSIGIPESEEPNGTTMSDIVLVALDAAPSVRRHGRALAPLPDVVGTSGFGLWFELYGLPDSSQSYVATIRARRLTPGALRADDAISLTFQGSPQRVADRTAAQMIEVETPWEPGEYRLELTVSVGGATFTRTRDLVVEE